MKYFIHSTSSFDDEKIVELFMEYGYEGLGLFYTILEKLAQQEKPIKTVVLKSQLRVGSRLNKVWDYMEKIGLISSNNGETFNEQLLSYSKRYLIKKEKNAKRISEWSKNQGRKKTVTHNEPPTEVVTPSWATGFKNYKPDIVYPFELIEFAKKWDLWIAYRKEKRISAYKRIGEQAALKNLAEISGGNIEVACSIIDKSISNNWQGLFPLKPNEKIGTNGKQGIDTRRAELKRIAEERYAVDQVSHHD